MRDEMVEGTPRTYSGALLAAIAVAIFLGLGGILWSYTLSSKLSSSMSRRRTPSWQQHCRRPMPG